MTITPGRRLSVAVTGNAETPADGLIYEQRVLALLPDYGVQPALVQLPGHFPDPGAADVAEAGKRLVACPANVPVLLDGRVLASLPLALIEGMPHHLLALIHHPLSLEPGLPAKTAEMLKARETAGLRRADHVIATSFATKRLLTSELGVAARKITVAEPGTDPAPRASGTGTPLQLLSVGTVSAQKGYDQLIKALEPLKTLNWRLTVAGATDRDTDTAAALEGLIAMLGLADRVRLSGAVVPATLARFYDSADLFVMPAPPDGHVTALAEAMARGLPIVCAKADPEADAVPDAAAIKVAPGDVSQLTTAIERVLTEKRLRARMADASWEMGRTLPPWTETTRRIAAVVMGLAP